MTTIDTTPPKKLRHTAHFETEVQGFQVADYTTPNDTNTAELDLIWVGYFGEGRWLTREEAFQLAAAITTATDNQARRMAARAAASTNDGAAA